MFLPFHDDNPITRRPYVTIAIIVINVVSLMYQNSLPARTGHGEPAIVKHIYKYGFVPFRLKQLTDRRVLRVDMYPPAARRPGQIVPRGRARFIEYQPKPAGILLSAFTSMFLHANLLHLLSNMWFFWIFGNNIEDRLGHVTFLLFYITGGLIATLTHYLMSPAEATLTPVIGASGAVAVTLGAYAVFYPFAKVHTLVFLVIFFTVIDLPALVVLGIWFVTQLMSGIQPPVAGAGVAWWAHIGGFVVGAVLMPVLAAGTPEPGENWEREATDGFGPGPRRRPPDHQRPRDRW